MPPLILRATPPARQRHRQPATRCERDATTLYPTDTQCPTCSEPLHPAIRSARYSPTPIMHGPGPLYLGMEIEIKSRAEIGDFFQVTGAL